jgi:hypothetical protein
MNDYADYLAENLDKSIDYSEYIAEQMDKTISYSDYICDPMTDKEKMEWERKQKRYLREKKIKRIFKDE